MVFSYFDRGFLKEEGELSHKLAAGQAVGCLLAQSNMQYSTINQVYQQFLNQILS